MAIAALAAALLALAAGCGEDQRDAYADDYRPLSRQIASLGEFTGNAVDTAERKTDAQIEEQFAQIADEMARLRGELEGLDAPDGVAGAHRAMVDAMRTAEEALRGIQRAAAQSNPRDARRETIELVRASEDLRDARSRLDGATR
ncbi:MAG TPA: hypothetical protein VHG69_07300 [Thermoleophilaceae bacterium]|nr:hypothetical protein [Thermoleophilaceae bacterium]